MLNPNAEPDHFRLHASAAQLSARRHTTDMNVFHQIFVNREYRCLDDVGRQASSSTAAHMSAIRAPTFFHGFQTARSLPSSRTQTIL
jgi:hypothetical protein